MAEATEEHASGKHGIVAPARFFGSLFSSKIPSNLARFRRLTIV